MTYIEAVLKIRKLPELEDGYKYVATDRGAVYITDIKEKQGTVADYHTSFNALITNDVSYYVNKIKDIEETEFMPREKRSKRKILNSIRQLPKLKFGCRYGYGFGGSIYVKNYNRIIDLYKDFGHFVDDKQTYTAKRYNKHIKTT